MLLFLAGTKGVTEVEERSASSTLDIIIGACVGAGVLIICIFIIIGIIFFIRRHLSSKTKLENSDDGRRISEYSNQAFAEEDPYNELPADKVHTTEQNGKDMRNGHSSGNTAIAF